MTEHSESSWSYSIGDLSFEMHDGDIYVSVGGEMLYKLSPQNMRDLRTFASAMIESVEDTHFWGGFKDYEHDFFTNKSNEDV